MEIGMAPFKSLMQTGFMMWMSGSSVNIFSIMVTGMIIMNTVKSLLNLQGGAFRGVGCMNAAQVTVVAPLNPPGHAHYCAFAAANTQRSRP